MYLKYVQIVNYKNLKSVFFEFGKGANTIIGENDSGKSNAMMALRILLDDEYYYNTKRLKETDFSDDLDEWRGHWIIVSAFFDEITLEDQISELSTQITPEKEDESFLRQYVRCEGNNYGVVSLFIRPNKAKRKALFLAKTKEEFERVRREISLQDYEFYYTARSQADYTDEEIYKNLVGDLENGKVSDPDDEDRMLIGVKTEILDIWKHVSLEYIDALRDAKTELRKPKNPLNRIFYIVHNDIKEETIESIKEKIRELNQSLSDIPQIQGIGEDLNGKLNDIVGLIYSPEVSIESHMREELGSIARNLAIVPTDEDDIEQLGLGHLNILYIALKLVEFEKSRDHEILNIMIVEEPEAHIHTHIQRTLFENLNVKEHYTQVIMTTHSTHLSEVSNISKMNVLKRSGKFSVVMRPTVGLSKYGKDVLGISDVPVERSIERYLDAKRSVLLFSKAVILVEGDGEEFLIPALVKNCLGVTLDELGIGLINVGSIAFEYLASLFSDERLQRRCAIITDLDATVEGACKCNINAEELGKKRKEKLDYLFKHNQWVQAFYAPHTLEVDFYNLEQNINFAKEIIENHYKQDATINKHLTNLAANEGKRYDSVLTFVNDIGKGWHAILLAEKIDCTVAIPNYILEALAFSSQDVVTPHVLRKMALYVLGFYDNEEELKENIFNSKTETQIVKNIDIMCQKYKDDDFVAFVKCWRKYYFHE